MAGASVRRIRRADRGPVRRAVSCCNARRCSRSARPLSPRSSTRAPVDRARHAPAGAAHPRRAEPPGHLADQEGQRADRERSDAGARRHAAALQLRRLHRPGRRSRRFEKKYAQYGVKVKVSTFNDTDEAITKIRTGAVPVRHLLPELRPDQPAGRGRADPAAQPQLPDQHRQPVAGVQEPLVRPGLALHRPVHRLHDGHRLARRPGEHRHRRAAQPVRHAVGPEVPRRDRGDRRLAHRMAMCLLRAGITDSTPRRPATCSVIKRPARRPASATAAQGHDHDVQRPPRRPARPVPDVVGRRRERAVLPAEGHVGRRAALLVPRATARAWSTTT